MAYRSPAPYVRRRRGRNIDGVGFADKVAGYTTSEGDVPSLIIDFCQGVYASRALDGEDYRAGDNNIEPTLVLDFQNGYAATRGLDVTDYNAEVSTRPSLVLDFPNKFHGAS